MIISSIIIPTLNESNHIEQCLSSVIQNNLLINQCEILVIDGGSTDDTIKKVEKLKGDFANIRLLNNPRKITPCALNIGIKNSHGKYIIRLDAHAKYNNGYIDETIKFLDQSDSDVMNVGGVIDTVRGKDNLISKSIAIVLSSKFGVGDSLFRTQSPDRNISVDTVPFGGFKKEVFDKVGLFDENEPRNEDLELNYRIKKAGFKIILSKKLSTTYFSRGSLISFLQQAFDNGYIVTNRFRKGIIFHKLRHFVPLFFSFFLFMAMFNVIVLQNNFLIFFSLLVILLYLITSLTFTIYHVFYRRDFRLLLMPFTFFLLHFTYGLGSIYGIFNTIKNGIKYLTK